MILIHYVMHLYLLLLVELKYKMIITISPFDQAGTAWVGSGPCGLRVCVLFDSYVQAWYKFLIIYIYDLNWAKNWWFLTPKEFKTLNQDKKDELVAWQKTSDGKTTIRMTTEEHKNKRKIDKGDRNKSQDNDNVNKKKETWLKNFKHLMYVLAKEESSNAAFMVSLNAINTLVASLPPPPLKIPLPHLRRQ